MKKKAQVTSKISTEVKWADDYDYQYHESVGVFYFDTLPSGEYFFPDGEEAYIDLEERLMYIAGQVVSPIAVPDPLSTHIYKYWVPGRDYAHENNPECVLQDFKRCLGLHRGEWNYQGCVAQVILEVKTGGEQGVYRINEMVIGCGSLIIESDCSKWFQESVEAD